MAKFEVFLKPNSISKIGNPRAYDTEFSTEPYNKAFNRGHKSPTSRDYSMKFLDNRRKGK